MRTRFLFCRLPVPTSNVALSSRFCSTVPSTNTAAPTAVATNTGKVPKPPLAHNERRKDKKLNKKGSQHPNLVGGNANTCDTSAAIPKWFALHRSKTLKDLEANQNDKSNAGRVDPLILPSVELINSYEHYCTASSCSGRVSVFHRAMPAKNATNSDKKAADISSEGAAMPTIGDDANIPMDIAIANKKRGNGIGTVFSSHDPLPDTMAVATQVYKALVAAKVPTTASSAPSHALAELLQVKFEPTILHTTCATMADAHRFIAAASESGHRTTGIVVSRAGKEEGRDASAEAITVASPSTAPFVVEEGASLGSSAVDADAASNQASTSAEALARVGNGWKITAKMQSMVCFDAPLYTATSGWLLHGGHTPLPDIFASDELTTAEEKAIGANFIAMLDRLLSHGNALFAENVERRERFLDVLKEMETAAAKKKLKK